MHRPLTIDVDAVVSLNQGALDGSSKGLPPDARSVGDLFGRSLEAFPTPHAVLSEGRLVHNIALMAEYCAPRGIWLAPHAKTTRSPSIVARQVAAGSWAVTAATVGQVALWRRFGVNRLFLANEVVDHVSVRWLAGELGAHPGFELFCLVDSPHGVEILDQLPPGRVNVLVELGHLGGRTGVRSETELRDLAEAVTRSTQTLAGIEGYEGLLGTYAPRADLAAVDRYLERLAGAAEIVAPFLGDQAETMLLSAGGSAAFDRVAEQLGDIDGTQLVLRSGCYVTHDAGWYEQASPLGARGFGPLRTAALGGRQARLADAIEVHATVISRPEPEFGVADAGKRDVGSDLGLPVVHRRVGPTGARFPLSPRPEVSKLSDQHTHLTEAAGLTIGDRIALGVSHPCSTFDRWRLIPIVDTADRVTDVAVTFF